MSKRVLMSGIGGFVGSHLFTHIMRNTDWVVVGIDSFRHKGKTDRLSDIIEGNPEYRERLELITHDLVAPISNIMDRRIGKIDYVFNIASESHVDRSITDPRPFVENNVALQLTMLEWLRDHTEVQMFLQCSTDEVYGPAYENDHPEGDPHRPSNPYSASKSAQEQLCYSYWRTFNLPIVITNTMNMIGEYQDTEKYIPKIIKSIIEDKEITVHISPDGVPGSRYYLHARNLADAYVFLANNHTPAQYPAKDIDRFNVASNTEVDNREMVKIIAGLVGKEAKTTEVDFHSSRPGHDLRYGLDSKKIRALGWKEPVEFDECIKRTVDWYLNNPEWLI